ncbi:GNAT family N-acetyltransferase [Huaxiibacter chinensis]
MTIRRAVPQEAETLWDVRNQAIRHGCQTSYAADVIARWTPENMPESYRQCVIENPFFVAEDKSGNVVATGYLDLMQHSIEAIFTLPSASGQGYARQIMAVLLEEARGNDIPHVTLAATPNAQRFYEKMGFVTVKESLYPSRLAETDLRCFDMTLAL